ncbi:endoribonuclease YicC domain-containing protein [Geothrix fermentans]|nr:DUF1732 domain-containing protein [Geothrix fermentans]
MAFTDTTGNKKSTTGSKCKRIAMTRAVMEAKGALDQIREQSANLE